jgi:hypothetical protein
MHEYIKEVYSDATITKVELKDSDLCVHLTQYTEDKVQIIFKNVLSVNIEQNWNFPEGIEGLEVRRQDDHLSKILDQHNTNKERFKLFLFIGHPDEVMKIIAEDFSILNL